MHVKVEESPIFRRKHVLGEERSVSVDRYKYTQNEEGGFTKTAPKVQEYHHRVISPLASRPSHPHPFTPGSGDTRFGKIKLNVPRLIRPTIFFFRATLKPTLIGPDQH